MERTVPETVSEGIELYIRTYYSLLRSSGDIRIRSLEETHEGMRSSLHLGAESKDFDASAFLYAALRLPDCMFRVRRVVMGQTEEVFRTAGIDVSLWQRVDARARRRRMLFDGEDTVAAFVSSVSDIDDLIPTLTAYQIEWNKLHVRLASGQLGHDLAAGKVRAGAVIEPLREVLQLSEADMDRLRQVWHPNWDEQVQALAQRATDLRVNSLASGFRNYRKAVQTWWDDLEQAAEVHHLDIRPAYFVSSNPHSLPNLLSGHAWSQREDMVRFAVENDPEGLAGEWPRLEGAGEGTAAAANFLYYLQRAYNRSDGERRRLWQQAETEAGIYRFDDPHSLDISAQIIDLREVRPERFDERLLMPGLARLRASNALIINVDYPLGFAAYQLFSQISSGVGSLSGAYIMGKAATLSARVGDVMIPNVVYDEHSRNTFLFKNCFLAENVSPFLVHGDVFDNQKAVTVRGTFLQNRDFMGVFYREGYTDIEMEAGPYLSAVYEDIYPRRYPVNEIVNLFINAPYDVGMLHYASDTPYSRRQSLLSKSMSYFGVDATYACAVAILRRIFQAELARLG
jgi:hypothetical protein